MKEKIINILLPILIIIQPILSLYELYYNPIFEIAGFQISTIIRYLLLGILGLILIYKTKLKTYRKSLIIYSILLIIYIIFHHLNALHFKSLIPGNLNYSLIEEILYLIRYLIPIFLVYYMYHNETSSSTFRKIILIFCFIVSLNVIITNIFYLSRTSYDNFKTTYNIFDWFTKSNQISHINASSKGLFYSPSIITTLLIITPYIFYSFFNDGHKIDLICLICNMLALFMVGTRACAYGYVLIAVLMPIIYLIVTILNKKTIVVKRVVIVTFLIIISGFIFAKSPAITREQFENNTIQNITNNTPKITEDDEEDKDLKELTINDIYNISDRNRQKELTIKYIKNNIKVLGVYEKFPDKYPYQYDWEFWLETLVKEPPEAKANSRFIEEKMLKRVKEINNNKYDNLLGLTYSRTSKVFNLERDYVYQYYSLGIIGLILLVIPLLAIFIYNGFKVLNKKHFNLLNISLCFGLGLIFCIAYYSGDILDNIATNTIIGFTLGYLVKNIADENKVKVKKIAKK